MRLARTGKTREARWVRLVITHGNRHFRAPPQDAKAAIWPIRYGFVTAVLSVPETPESPTRQPRPRWATALYLAFGLLAAVGVLVAFLPVHDNVEGTHMCLPIRDGWKA